MARLLVIEDNDALRAGLEDVLRRLGHSVTTLPNGKAVVDRGIDGTPDLVLTDIFMPEADGLETIKAVRKCCPQTLIVAMSGGALCFDAKRPFEWAKALGADAVLEKPICRKALQTVLAECMSAAGRLRACPVEGVLDPTSAREDPESVPPNASSVPRSHAGIPSPSR